MVVEVAGRSQDGPGNDPTTSSAMIGRICEGCIDDVDVDGGGVTVVTDQGYFGTVWTSDGLASRIDDLQYTLGVGPCLEAASTGRPVLVADLSRRGRDRSERWPGFNAEAMAAGVHAVFGLPLKVGDVKLGSINLYRRTPGALSKRHVMRAREAAQEASRVLVNLSSSEGGEDADADGASYHWAVHQAAGMLTQQLGVTIEEALLQLRATAFAESVSVDELAADVASRRRRMSKEDA